MKHHTESGLPAWKHMLRSDSRERCLVRNSARGPDATNNFENVTWRTLSGRRCSCVGSWTYRRSLLVVMAVFTALGAHLPPVGHIAMERSASAGERDTPAEHALSQQETRRPSVSQPSSGDGSTAPSWVKFNTPEEEIAYLDHLKQLLESGFGSRSSGLKAAKTEFYKAGRLCKTDPRLPFALGLVYRKQFKREDSIAQFGRAADYSTRPYLPAWRALVWMLVSSRDYDSALKRMAQQVRLLEESNGDWPDEVAKEEWFRWSGSMMAYLKTPAGLSSRVAESVAKRDEEMRGSLKERHRLAYDEGQKVVIQQYRKLMDSADHDLEQDLQQHRIDLKEKKKLLEERKDKAEEGREELKGNADELQEDFERQLKSKDKELLNTWNEYQARKKLETALKWRVNQMQAECDRQSETSGEIEKGSMMRLQELQRQYSEACVLTETVRRNGDGLLRDRQLLTAQYQRLTGKLIQQDRQFQKIQQQLKRQDKVIEKGKVPVSRGSKRRRNEARLLATYLSFDVDTEKDRLLDSLQVRRRRTRAPEGE